MTRKASGSSDQTASFRVDRDLLDRFRRTVREREDRTASAQIRRLIREYVAEHDDEKARAA